MTNNTLLIKYLKQNSIEEAYYELKKQDVDLITIKQFNVELVLKWMNETIEESDLKYIKEDIRLYTSHAITSNSHLFIIKNNSLAIGLAGYTVINETGIIDIKIYENETIKHQDEDIILKLLLDHIRHVHRPTCFKAIVSESDAMINKMYLRNSFFIDEIQTLESENSSSKTLIENIYRLNGSGIIITGAEKFILNEFLELYPDKLFELGNPDELIDLEHSIDYSLKIYARLILSRQLDQQDEFGDIFVDDNGYLSIEDNLVGKYDDIMELLVGEDLKIAIEYKSLMFLVLDIINKHIKCFQEMKIYQMKKH